MAANYPKGEKYYSQRERDAAVAAAEQRGFDKGFHDAMEWRIDGPSAVDYWQGKERDRIRTGVKALTEWPYLPPSWSKDFLAVIDPKEGPDD